MGAAVAVAFSVLALQIAIVLAALPVTDGSMEGLTGLLKGCLFCLACGAAPAAVLTLVSSVIALTARKTAGELDVGPDGVSIELAAGRRLIPYEAVLEGMA